MVQVVSFRQDTDSIYRWETILPSHIHCGAPQSFVLGPILFILYTQPLSCVIGSHSVSHQPYADETQIYSSSSPSEISATIHNMEKCICDVKYWMICNTLQMNYDKTEAILIATQRTYISHALPSSLNLNGIPIEFSKSLKSLGIIFGSFFFLHQYIMNTCTAAYIELRRISSIQHFPSVDATKTLICSVVL